MLDLKGYRLGRFIAQELKLLKQIMVWIRSLRNTILKDLSAFFNSYIYIYIYIHSYIYIYIKILGPPKVGRTNERKTLFRMNFYFSKIWNVAKQVFVEVRFGVFGVLCIINCYFECR